MTIAVTILSFASFWLAACAACAAPAAGAVALFVAMTRKGVRLDV